MKKIFEEYEKEIKIKPIEETLKDVELIKKPSIEKDIEHIKKVYRTKKIIKWSTIIAVPVLVIGVLGTFMFFDIEDDYSVIKKNFNFSEIQKINKNTFKSLNEVLYPKDLTKKSYDLEESFIKGVNDFSYGIFEKGKHINNFGYSPISLYHHLDILSGLVNEDLKPAFDELLKVDSSIRNEEVRKNFLNNFYQEKDVGMSMYNGLFITNKYKMAESTIDFLTKKYVEAYELSFEKKSDLELMLKRVNEKSDLNLSIEDLEPQVDTLFYLFSTMNYINTWNTLFLKEDTKVDVFNNSDGTQSDVNYMKHSYFGRLADYEDYVSFYDYYNNGYKIQYIISKDKNKKLSDLLKDKNYLYDDDTKMKDAIIELMVPKFTYNETINFNDIFSTTEIGDVYNKNSNSFDEMIVNEKLDYSYLEFTKQQNKITIDESGTKIKTLTYSMGAGDAGSPSTGEYSIKLNHEFYYIIKDFNNIPIFMGEYSNAM